MKNQIYLLLGIVMGTVDASAQLSSLWKNDAEMATYDRKRIYEAPNGNVVLARMDDYYGIGDGNDLLKCYDADGNLLWEFGEEDFSDNSASNFLDIDFDSESNTYVAGSNFPQTAFYPKTEVIKISPTGEELWRINFTQQSTWSEIVVGIEITDDDRIFLLARLYNGEIDTLAPSLIEIDENGETLMNHPDPQFEIGLGELFEPGDGFLYVVEENRVVKLNYDASIVWSETINFGAAFQSYFQYHTEEYCVKFHDGKIYLAQRVDDLTSPARYYGITVFSADGTHVSSFYSLFDDQSSVYSIAPLYLEIDAQGNKYVVGDYVYGDAGPTAENEGDELVFGGKGSSYRGVFVTKVDDGNFQNWVLNYPELDAGPNRYPNGTFLTDNKLAVVYKYSSAEIDQLTECYQIGDGAVAWSHYEGVNESFISSDPYSCYHAANGALYVAGTGANEGEFGYVYSIYLYKYEMLTSDIEKIGSETVAVIWPNPANNLLNIASEGAIETITVYDITGKISLFQSVNAAFVSLDVSSLAPGVYAVHLDGERSSVVKFVVD